MRTESEVACTKTMYRVLVRVPTSKRLQACEGALQIIDSYLGEDSYMYQSIMTIKVVCLVHEMVNELHHEHDLESLEEPPPNLPRPAAETAS